ncbi:cullin-3-B-like [Neocloeon triangulifer]|uniref:cullin-3-B-like n=1 Tax=Neocloeon triangulifer TaxID=2078957 RepID=UPI00286F35B1|nr:cullin-3-B-like [Neocloeon triangulifer]
MIDDQVADQLWLVLEKAFKAIQSKCKTENLSFVELYKNAYELIINQRSSNLYFQLKHVVEEHLSTTVRTRIMNSMDGNFLATLAQEWSDHEVAMRMIRDIVMYLELAYTDNHDMDNVFNLGMICLREQLVNFPAIKEMLVSNLLELIAKERAGEVIDRMAMKNTLNMLIILGISSNDYYTLTFENDFIRKSISFYQMEASKFIKNNKLSDYLAMTKKRMDEEKDRNQHYLPRSTHERIISVVENELVKRRMKQILEIGNGEVRRAIVAEQISVLKNLYTIFKKHEGGTDLILEQFLKTLTEQCTAIQQEEQAGNAAAAAGPSRDNSPTTAAINMVQNLIEIRIKFNKIVDEAFEKDATFADKLDTAYKNFVKEKINVAESLSLHINNFLKKGDKNISDEELEVKMDGSMFIVKCLRDMDAFEQYYRKHFSLRILEDKSIGDDIERAMVGRLKALCGWQTTHHLEQMFKDIQMSSDFSDEFKRMLNENEHLRKTETDLQIKVVREGVWLTRPLDSTIVIHPDAVSSYELFQLFYLKKFEHKKIRLHPSFGNADLKARFFDANGKIVRTQIINVPTLMMFVLLLFNDNEVLTLEEIKSATSMPENQVRIILNRLTFGPVNIRILKKSTQPREITASDTFTINNDFKSKRHKVRIQADDAEKETPAERQETDDILLKQRKVEISAAIVRVMKTRRTLGHNQLLTEVYDQVKHRFTPEPSKIKTVIGELIEKEYIARAPDAIDTYTYIA